MRDFGREAEHRVERRPALGTRQEVEELVAVAAAHLPPRPLHWHAMAPQRTEYPRRLDSQRGHRGDARLLHPDPGPAAPDAVELPEVLLGEGARVGALGQPLDADELDSPGLGLNVPVGAKHSLHEDDAVGRYRQGDRHHRREEHFFGKSEG